MKGKKMNRINQNNLEALKVYFGAKQAKKAEVEEKQEKTEAVKDFEVKKVEASALDAVAAQIWGAQLSKVDVSDNAVAKRMEEAFANAPFMKALNELQGIDEEIDFVTFAQASITGVDHAKLAKYLQQPLHQETLDKMANLEKTLTA